MSLTDDEISRLDASLERSMAEGDPADAIVAYCAPGQKDHAVRVLADRKERYREVIEHPYMTGRSDIILTTGPHGWDTTSATMNSRSQ
jgi:hypothetical protein